MGWSQHKSSHQHWAFRRVLHVVTCAEISPSRHPERCCMHIISHSCIWLLVRYILWSAQPSHHIKPEPLGEGLIWWLVLRWAYLAFPSMPYAYSLCDLLETTTPSSPVNLRVVHRDTYLLLHGTNSGGSRNWQTGRGGGGADFLQELMHTTAGSAILLYALEGSPRKKKNLRPHSRAF